VNAARNIVRLGLQALAEGVPILYGGEEVNVSPHGADSLFTFNFNGEREEVTDEQ
jgi:hypothetical protein